MNEKTITASNTADKCSTGMLAWRIRRHAVEMTGRGRSSHVGSVLSIADILGVLYGSVLNLFPDEPRHKERDRFILSKGHAGAGVYAALAETGFLSTQILKQHYQNGSILSGHVSHKGVPGVEFSTGSLGHGLPVGCGMAYAAKLAGHSHRVFVVMSDGECDEGSNWEALLFAAHHKLDNLTAIIDYNKLQSIKSVAETLNLEPFADKLRAFGWAVSVVNGHDHDELFAAFGGDKDTKGRPHVVLANTIKGRGVSFMENNVLWHYRTPQGEEYQAAVAELEQGKPAS